MSAVLPTFEALVSLGTLYQFFLARSSVDALESVSQQLKSKNRQTTQRKTIKERLLALKERFVAWRDGRRGPRARARAWRGVTAPASRDLVEEFANEYEKGIADHPIAAVMFESHCRVRRRHAKRHAVFFPDMQQVFHSDREVLGWSILCVATTGIFLDDLLSHPVTGGSSLAFILILIGFGAMYFWDRSVQKVLVATYKAEIERIRDGGHGATAAFPALGNDEKDSREATETP